jgi:hypothetical protein
MVNLQHNVIGRGGEPKDIVWKGGESNKQSHAKFIDETKVSFEHLIIGCFEKIFIFY